MSTDTETGDDSTTVTITLTHDPESEWWGVKDEALAGYHDAGEPPTEGELREEGIDPENNTSGSLEDSDIFQ